MFVIEWGKGMAINMDHYGMHQACRVGSNQQEIHIMMMIIGKSHLIGTK